MRLDRWQALTPERRTVEVWSARGEPQELENPQVLEAGPEFPALQLRLAEIWAGDHSSLAARHNSTLG